MKHTLLLAATFAAAAFAQTENLGLPTIGGTVFSGAGSNADSIKQVVDDFRTAIGNPLNAPGVNGNPAGRREINWDAVPDALSSPNALPADFFNKNSVRGAVFSGPVKGWIGFQVSAQRGHRAGALRKSRGRVFAAVSCIFRAAFVHQRRHQRLRR